MQLAHDGIVLTALTVEIFNAILEDKRYESLHTDGSWPSKEIRSIVLKDMVLYRRFPELLIWSVWIISDSQGQIVGDIGFKGPPDINGTVEIGYQLLPEYRGYGYATKSVGLLCDYAFSKGVESVEAEVHVKNAISELVVLKNGFVFVREEKQYRYFKKVCPQTENT